jgi:hypothetical protein
LIKQEEDIIADLITQQGVVKKELADAHKEETKHQDIVENMKEKERRLRENLDFLEKDIQRHKKEIRYIEISYWPIIINYILKYREREETVSDKDERIAELKKLNQVGMILIKLD